MFTSIYLAIAPAHIVCVSVKFGKCDVHQAYGYLPGQRNATIPWSVFICRPAEGRKLSWPGWLVTNLDGVPAKGHPSEY